ncbi:MAG: hypothetical protein LH603_12680, partial [Pseudonocardia sp.]|nr:hypothetical protein [Pseudonocardia sp.]
MARAAVAPELRSTLLQVRAGRALLEHVWTGERREIGCAFVVDCGHRLPEDALWLARPASPRAGDCVAPRTVYEAVLHLVEAPMPVGPGYALYVPSAIRAAVSVPGIGVGRFTVHGDAERALVAGHCDLVGVVRGQIADPDLAAAPTRTCVGCNQECVGRVGLNQRLGCVGGQPPHGPRGRAAPGADRPGPAGA